MSQSSPVYPASHRQVKFSPKSSAKQVPLLQSTRSQIDRGGLSVGVGVGVTVNAKDVVSSISTSQNIPVNPAKQSHMIVSFPRSMHTPLVQLTKSQSEMGGGEGVGEIMADELTGMLLVAMVVNGRSKLSVLEMKNKINEVVVAGVGVMMREGLEALDGSKTSQNSPVYPIKH